MELSYTDVGMLFGSRKECCLEMIATKVGDSFCLIIRKNRLIEPVLPSIATVSVVTFKQYRTELMKQGQMLPHLAHERACAHDRVVPLRVHFPGERWYLDVGQINRRVDQDSNLSFGEGYAG